MNLDHGIPCIIYDICRISSIFTLYAVILTAKTLKQTEVQLVAARLGCLYLLHQDFQSSFPFVFNSAAIHSVQIFPTSIITNETFRQSRSQLSICPGTSSDCGIRKLLGPRLVLAFPYLSVLPWDLLGIIETRGENNPGSPLCLIRDGS